MRFALVIPVLACCAIAYSDNPEPKEGSYYTYEQLGVQKQEVQGTKIKLIFRPISETEYWSPGVKVESTAKATIVTFIRCKNSQTCPVDTKARIGNRLIRSVEIDSRGLDTFVRTGPKKYKKIFEVEKTTGRPVRQAVVVTTTVPRQAYTDDLRRRENGMPQRSRDKLGITSDLPGDELPLAPLHTTPSQH